jgi:DNA-binding response OmpR family regulator
MTGASNDKAPDTAPYAPEILAWLRGSLFLLKGLDQFEFLQIAEILSAAGAIVAPSSSRAQAMEACEAIILGVPAKDDLPLGIGHGPPVLMVGAPEHLAAKISGPGASLAGFDFLTSPWTPAELILRASKLIASSSRARARVQGTGRRRVLIADDDPNISNLLSVALNGLADCAVVPNGLAALEAIRELPPDALILDLEMPIMNGFEVLESIRGDPGLRCLPVILLTGSVESEYVSRGLGLGANDYVVKPFGMNGLVQRIRRILAGTAAIAP